MFFFPEKWFFSELKNFLGFKMIEKLYEKHLTSGRYPVQKICPSKKQDLYYFYEIFVGTLIFTAAIYFTNNWK